MFVTSLFLLVAYLGLAVLAQSHHGINGLQPKRQAMTCEQTYGSGSKSCGESGSAFCFNPDIGQTCCPMDGGYCDKGQWCAPVAGYCCQEGENLETCAKKAGFDLPSNSTVKATSAVVTAETVVVTETVSSCETSVPVPASAPPSQVSGTPIYTTATPAPSPISNFNYTTPTHISGIQTTNVPFVHVGSGTRSAGRATGSLWVAVMVSVLGVTLY